MADKNLELALLLKLNDQMSRGLRAAMRTAQDESKKTGRSLADIAKSTNNIKPTGIERLNKALRTVQNTAKGVLGTLNNIARAGAAVAAGGYVLKAAAERPIAYDRRLALLSNTANSGLDAAGRIRAKAQLDAAIRNASRFGGSPEQNAETLNTLVGSGAFGNANQAAGLLPMLAKFQTGTGAPGNDLAQIMVAAKQTMGMSDAQLPVMLSKAIRAGQEGGFELTDMAKWLPQQMSIAAANGMKGMRGFESLLAGNQVSRITAGTSDEAGNNLVNLLAKINSSDTAQDFKKVGIDLPGSLSAARDKGMNTLEAFVSLVDKVASRDAGYNKLRKQADSQTGADRKATLEAMADIMQQKSLGKVVQDRQALMALLALMQQRGKYNEVKNAVLSEAGQEGETSFQTVASTTDFKAEQLGNKKAFAAMDALASLDDPLNKVLDTTNQLAEANPKLAAATYSATTALTALAAMAGVGTLLGGGKAAGGAAGLSKLSKLRGGPLLALTAAGAGGDLAGHALYNAMPNNWQNKIGETIASYLAAFGNREAERALNINLSVDGQQLATVVNSSNAKQARRR